MATITLSRDQDVALSRIFQWLKGGDQFFVLDGPAGSGKSELARRIGGDRETIYCSYTGKAANVLRSRGLQASTLHRALYRPKEKSQARLQQMMAALIQLERSLEKTPGDQKLRSQCDQMRRDIRTEKGRTRSPSWSVPDDAPVKSADLVVVDEYSMLDAKNVEDLKNNAKKVLFLGDPHQLPPVKGTCPLTGRANFTLTEVHRQALDNPILRAVTQIRQDARLLPSMSNEHGCWELLSSKQTNWDEHYAVADQLIVAKNATRATFNKKFRAKLWRDGVAAVGERIIFLRNDHTLEIYNGSTAEVLKLVDDGDLLDLEVRLDDGRETFVDTWSGVFRGLDADDAPRQTMVADYGYAITCHKSQGSEYDHVIVWNEGFAGDLRRWMYTAASRAKRRCTFIQVGR